MATATYALTIGNRNYSSWSLRAWLAMKQTGFAFDETLLPLGTPAGRFEVGLKSPSRKVPVLRHGSLVVWDSLAIAEYLAEQAPAAGLWPSGVTERAVARAMCAEMHSGFESLRLHMPMNVRASRPGAGQGDGVRGDVARILALWRDARGRFGANGPYLFGTWCIADAFFAPVVSRFATYGVDLDEVGAAYRDAVLCWPAVVEWFEEARREPWTIETTDAIS